MPAGKLPNLADDQQDAIKIQVLPDLLKTKGVRHLNTRRLDNIEKKRLPILSIGLNILN